VVNRLRMDNQSPMVEPAFLLKKIDDLYLKLEAACNLLSGGLIFGVMLLGVAEVLMRKLFDSPIPGQTDLVEISLPMIAFLGLSYCHRQAGHVRMALLMQFLTQRGKYIAEFAVTIPSLILVGFLVIGTWEHFWRALSFGDSTESAEIPIWPAKLTVTVALIILFLRLCIQLFGYLRLIKNPQAQEIGVPHNPTLTELVAAKARESEEAI